MAIKVERPPVAGGRKPLFPRLVRALNRESFFQNVLAMPMQLLLWFLLIIPTLIVLYLSLVAWEPRMGVDWWQAPFAWFRNYGHVLSDVRFWQAIVRTIGVVVVAVALEFAIGLALALFFQRDFLGKRLFTAVILYPMMLPWVVVGLAFYLLFLEKGLVNYILIHFLGFETGVAWYHYPAVALSTIILADVWQWTPFMFLILYSGLGALPRDPVEAAMTLGASRWQIFRYITMPMLKQVIIIALIIRSLEAFKIFDLVFIMTGGGPGTATESLSLYIYRLGFVYGQLSYAAAMAVLILVSISIIIRLAVRPLEYEV
ncbi:MAG TPA: sugar ABC transporter permease [Chloroflexi bacterium]|nr:sugar ABC transporter permease [Chloroflexota bacterium]